MPNRILRDGILSSEAVCSLNWAAEVFYRRLQSVVDDYGRFSANAILIRSACYPLQVDKVSDSDVGKWLTQVVEAGLVRVYPASDGKRYLEILKFGQQQRSKSKYPAPDSNGNHLIANDINCSQVKSFAHPDVVVVEDVSEDDKRPAVADLLSGVSEQIAKDFRKLRQSKKAPLTQTAVDGIKREAAKAGLTLEAALAVCCERGWTGFKADWMNSGSFGKPASEPRRQPPPKAVVVHQRTVAEGVDARVGGMIGDLAKRLGTNG